MLVIKIVLTLILATFLTGGVPFIISEIRDFKNWARLVATLMLFILAALDIYILWFT